MHWFDHYDVCNRLRDLVAIVAWSNTLRFLQMESTTSCRRETCTFCELTKVTLEFPFRA